MGRRVELLTDVSRLPRGCGQCLFWELGGASGPGAGDRKQEWIAACLREGTPAGRVLTIDGQVAGYTLSGPAGSFASRVPPVPRSSRDAWLLATLWVRPTDRERGVGRRLLLATLSDALDHGAVAVEAYGDRRFREQGCVLPAAWLLHEGFVVHAEHPRTPLLRLDLRRTARWAESLEHAWDELRGRLPAPAAAPAKPRPVTGTEVY